MLSWVFYLVSRLTYGGYVLGQNWERYGSYEAFRLSDYCDYSHFDRGLHLDQAQEKTCLSKNEHLLIRGLNLVICIKKIATTGVSINQSGV